MTSLPSSSNSVIIWSSISSVGYSPSDDRTVLNSFKVQYEFKKRMFCFTLLEIDPLSSMSNKSKRSCISRICFGFSRISVNSFFAPSANWFWSNSTLKSVRKWFKKQLRVFLINQKGVNLCVFCFMETATWKLSLLASASLAVRASYDQLFSPTFHFLVWKKFN